MDIAKAAHRVEHYATDIDCVSDALRIITTDLQENCLSDISDYINAFYALTARLYNISQELAEFGLRRFEVPSD